MCFMRAFVLFLVLCPLGVYAQQAPPAEERPLHRPRAPKNLKILRPTVESGRSWADFAPL